MSPFNWTATLLDEIALEGLDGITFQALWLRLEKSRSPFFGQPLSEPLKNFVWNAAVKFKDVQFFELPEPRPPLILFDWFCENENSELQIEPPEQIYKHYAIDDTDTGIMGSCPTYATRVDVSTEARKMTLDEAFNRWGQKLVIVASQEVRYNALVAPSVDPFMDLFSIPFCMLERIGRSRYGGEITNSKHSLQGMGLDPKNIFYHRKYLSKRKLICKQYFFVSSGSNFVTGNGNLLHLPRFYVEYESRMLFYLNVAVEHLKKMPNYTDTALSIIKIIGNTRYRKRLFKSQEFSQLISSETVPYQQYYPEATKKECITSKGNEKEVRIMRLKYPDVNVREFFNQLHDDDDDDDDDDDGDTAALFPNDGNRIMDRSTLSQAYQVIEEAGPVGLSTQEMGRKLGFTKLQSRFVMKVLKNQGYVDTVAIDRGRIRVIQFISMKYGKNTLERKKIFMEQEKTVMLANKQEKDALKRKKLVEALGQEGPASKKQKHDYDKDAVKDTPVEEVSMLTESSDDLDKTPITASIDRTSLRIEQFIEAQGNLSSSIKPKAGSQANEGKVVDVFITPVPTYQEWDVKRILRKKLASHRMLRRKNLILEAVQKDEIITSFFTLKKKIMKAEEGDETTGQIDKKTLIKLVLRLEAEGLLKTYSYLLKAKSRLEKLTIVCLPHIPADNPRVLNAVDHAKLRMSVVSKEKVKAEVKSLQSKMFSDVTPSSTSDAAKPTQDLEVLSSTYLQNFRNVPKFVKIQLAHQLLFYLVHFYEGNENLDQDTIKTEISALADLNAIKDVTLPRVYHFSKDLNWKLFIPPSPKHAEVHKGWITIGELTLRMPLSMLVQICSLNYLIPEIYDYLSHPVYKHILLKDLPITIRSALTFGRVYVMAIHRVLTLAAYLGLVQFGPHRHKDKDLVQVYLNRQATLYNTTTSARGYIFISDMDYAKKTYHFDSMDDVNQYWIDAMMFCTNTQLGSRETMSGKSVVIEMLDSKPDVVKATTERHFDEVEQYDTGEIPGDGKGAAGFDSAFYAHLKRNWHWANKTLRKPIKLHPYLESASKSNTAAMVKPPSKAEPSKKKIVVKKLKLAPAGPAVVPKQFIKKTVPRVKKFKEKTVRVRKPLYDAIDQRALANMRTERTSWSAEEDNVLLLIKVSALYFNQKNQRCISYYRMARDFLHQKVECSKNKTSKAVQRRLLHLTRRPPIARAISVCNAEIQFDQALQEKFSEVLGLCAAYAENDDTVQVGQPNRDIPLRNKTVLKAMADLTEILLLRYPRLYISSLDKEDTLVQYIPDSVEELKSLYDCVCPSLDKSAPKPTTPADVIISVIANLIYSSICCQSAKTSYSLQLFYAFKHYPEKYLRAALSKLQAEQMISRRKHDGKYSKMKVSSFLPISSSCYQLSNMYSIKLMVKYQHMIFRAAFAFNAELTEGQPVQVINYDGGKAAVISSLMASNLVAFRIEIPEQLIGLNPAVEESRLGDLRLVTRMKNHFLGSGIRPTSSKKKEKETTISTSESEDSDSDFESNLFTTMALNSPSTSIAKAKKNKKADESLISNLAQNFKSEDLFYVKGCQFSVELKEDKKPEVILLEEDGSYRSVSMVEFQPLVAAVLEEFRLKHVHHHFDEIDDQLIVDLRANAEIAIEILALLLSRKEAGAISSEIGEKFGTSDRVASIIQTLVRNHAIVRTGTNRIHFIHHKHARSWFVHSFQMVRLDREKLDVDVVTDVVAQKNKSDLIKVIDVTNEEPGIQNSSRMEVDEPLITSDDKEKSEPMDSASSSQLENNEQTATVSTSKHRDLPARRVGKLISSQPENLQKIKTLTDNEKKHIQILIRPWIKPDGSLNRRVLDRFLGAVLSRALERPFCSLRSLQEKFVPLLEPAYTFELIELLAKIKCINLKAKVVSGKVNLFSSGSKSVKLVPATCLEKEENIIIYPSVHALLTLSYFIGKAAYAADFMV
ncbi:unnamed protein product [Bemisia tabaci]|uniref:General transcription factor 3C polypeptide 1 n=1 Tax=Bemisia tabaci TaxID=7038 RepID=A0A9P0AGT4_BEMTA|nr:unnamed protein product [Bemisia tabaci]